MFRLMSSSWLKGGSLMMINYLFGELGPRPRASAYGKSPLLFRDP